jgi:hypothetical protein
MVKIAPTRTVKLLPALVLVALVLPSSAFGQATRTWVSGVGDDVNPCSRTAPCKTFAGAISKTATDGIINAMDDGGFGAVTITKGITIDGGRHTAGVLASGGINAININIASGVGRVVLRNLDIEGNGTTLGLNGVNIINARAVKIVNSQISFFSRSGVLQVSTSNPSRVIIQNTKIHDNGGNGVTVSPPAGVTGTATVRDSDIDDNSCAVLATNLGMSNVFATECGANAPGAGTGVAIANIYRTAMSDNFSRGVEARGAATARVSAVEISGSNFGLRELDGGSIESFGNNVLAGNGANLAPGTTLTGLGPLLKRLPR